MTVGEKIRKTRKQKKMTQNTLARLTGLAAITIRQYEANKYIPKIENLRKIAHALDTSLSEFLEPGQTISEYDIDDDVWNSLIKTNDGKLHQEIETKIINGNFQLNGEQRRILLLFDALNADGKKEALKRIEELSFIPAYSIRHFLRLTPASYILNSALN